MIYKNINIPAVSSDEQLKAMRFVDAMEAERFEDLEVIAEMHVYDYIGWYTTHLNLSHPFIVVNGPVFHQQADLLSWLDLQLEIIN